MTARVLALALALAPASAEAQSRLWRPDERALITDLSFVTAVAATRQVVYAATSNGLAVYDRAFRAWRETVGALEGYRTGEVTAMAADPADDTAWLGGRGGWMSYQPLGRRLDGGPLPGVVIQVVLDARSPSSGAYFRTTAGWYFVPRGGVSAQGAVPPPASAQQGSLTPAQLRARLPAYDAIRARIETDEAMRMFRVTSATLTPVTNEVFLGTDGNGVFMVDPVTYATSRLPAGLAGVAATALAESRGQICAGTSRRIAAERRGVTCFDESLRDITVYEGQRSMLMPGNGIRDVLVTPDAVWAATDAGLVRADRRRGRLELVNLSDDLPSDDVLALAPAPLGVWAGTARGLALVTDTGRAGPRARALGADVVLALAAGVDTLWAGTSAGMSALLPLATGLAAVLGPGPLREPVVGVAVRGDTIVAVTAGRLLVRTGGEWRVVEQPGPSIGRLASVSADEAGFWIGGSGGFALFEVERGVWHALLRDDVPGPVHDVLATRSYVWVATDLGVVRFDRRVLVR